MLKKIVKHFLLIALLFTTSSIAQAATLMPNTTATMQNPEFWARKPELRSTVLDEVQIKIFNQKLIDTKKIYALDKYPTRVSRADLVKQIQALQIPDDSLYVNGKLMSPPLKELLLDARDLSSIPAIVTPRYGVVVRRANMRTMPTSTAAYDSVTDKNFDMFQETVLDPAEPVIVLHESKNKGFLFVQMYNYRGWVASTDIALVKERTQWLKYVQSKDFIMVTAAKLKIQVGSEVVVAQMGSKLPLSTHQTNADFTVVMPTRGLQGELIEQNALVRNDSKVQYGYLPYTRENVIMQAFEMLGETYGWGGMFDSVDCSSFISNIYRTMGINLPRNADEQEAVAATVEKFNGNKVDALQVFAQLKPGTAVFKEGHVMLYIGSYKGVPYLIHSLSSYADARIMQVVVSDTNLRMRSGPLLIETLRTAVDYR